MRYLIIILVLIREVHCELQPPKQEISVELMNYFNNTRIGFRSAHNTVGTIVVNNEYPILVLNWFLKYRNHYPALIGQADFPFVGHIKPDKTDNLFCFVESVSHFNDIIEYIKINPFFRRDGNVQFIITKPVVNRTWLRSNIEYIWENSILNFIVVYQINNTVETIGYNPFNSSYYNFTNHKKRAVVFPDKLKDMHGYRLVVAMMVDVPRNYMDMSGLRGEDAVIVVEVAKRLNAKLEYLIVPDYPSIRAAITTGAANFSFTKHITTPTPKFIINPGYPLRFDYMVFVVPTADLKPQYQSLFLIFSENLWISLMIAFLIMTGSCFVIARTSKLQHLSLTESFFIIMQILMNYPYLNLRKAQAALKIFLISWAMFSLLITTGFNSELRSSLVTPKYDTEIMTVDDLRRSGLKISAQGFVAAEILKVYPELQGHILQANSVIPIILSFNKNTAFSLQLSYLENIVLKRDKNKRLIYRILREYVIGGHSVYNFPKHSPFIAKINSLVMLFREYGMDQFGENVSFGETASTASQDAVILTLQHLQTAFYALIIGYIMSFIIFASEWVQFKKWISYQKAT